MAEETKELTFAERVSRVQTALKAPKSKYNSFGDYHYRSLEDIFEAVKPLCKENDLLLIVTDKPTMVGDWHYIESTAQLYDAKDPNVFIENTSSARETLEKKKSDAAQITGAASSYARKYALNGLFLIDDTKDPDTDEYQRQNRGSETQTGKNTTASKKSAPAANTAADERITEQEAGALAKMLLPNQKKFALEHYKVKDLKELSKKAYVELVKTLKKREETDEAKSQD